MNVDIKCRHKSAAILTNTNTNMNMFARSKPIRAVPLQMEAPKLPRNFAEKLLEMETQLAFNMSVELISSLMQLYSVFYI